MSSKTVKWSSTLLIMAGVLLAIAMLFHPDVTQPGFATKATWVWAHVLLGVSALASVVGLAGLFSVMIRTMSNFGRAAFGLAILGNILMLGMMLFVETTLVPVLSHDPAYQPLLSQGGMLMSSSFGISIVISLVIAAVGSLLLAGYLVATKTITPVNGLLFIGAPLAAFTPPLPFAVGMIGGVIFGIGIAWLGASIRIGIGHQALASTLHIQDECFIHAGGHA